MVDFPNSPKVVFIRACGTILVNLVLWQFKLSFVLVYLSQIWYVRTTQLVPLVAKSNIFYGVIFLFLQNVTNDNVLFLINQCKPVQQNCNILDLTQRMTVRDMMLYVKSNIKVRLPYYTYSNTPSAHLQSNVCCLGSNTFIDEYNFNYIKTV